MDYKNLEELNESYKKGTFEFPSDMNVDGIPYHYAKSSDYNLPEMISGKLGMIAYIPESNEHEDLIFLTGTQPYKVVQLDEAAKKKAKAKKKPKAKSSTSSQSKGPDIAGLKGNMKNQMDKHKIHLDKHITKHGDVLKDLKQQMKDLGGANKGELEKHISKVEDMLNKHRGEMEKHAQGHDEKMRTLDDAYKELIQTHNDAVDRLGDEHSGKMDDLKAAFDEFRDAHDEQMDHLKREHEMHRSSMKRDHDEHVNKVMGDHGDKMYHMKRDHQDKIFDARRQSGEQLRRTQQGHEDKVNRMTQSHEENQEQMQMKHKGEMDTMQQKHNESKIGTEAHVEVLNLHGSPALKAKVDTGATICSLHADKMKVDQGSRTVKFTNKQLSPHIISVPVASMSSVKSADGGMTYRPVILLNLRIKEKEIASVEVNLNDREHMTHPFLIGHNALEKGKFIIDPGYIGEDEEIDFDYIQDILNESESEYILDPKE
jgi:hypothetical protein